MTARQKKKSNGADHVEQRITALRDDLNAIQDDVKGLAAGAAELAAERVDDVRSSLNESAANVQSLARARLNKALKDTQGVVDRLSDEVEDWAAGNVEGARKQIRTQPLKACLISLGAGALIGALLLRR